MLDPEKAAKFGYKEVTPFPELLHSIGLLHTARQVDISYALSQIKKILRQKKDSYAISIFYESQRASKDVYVVKTYKAGISGYEKNLKSRLRSAKIEYDSDIKATLTELNAKHTSLSYAMSSHIYASLSCHFRAVVFYDVTRNKYRMFMKDYQGQIRKAAHDTKEIKAP